MIKCLKPAKKDIRVINPKTKRELSKDGEDVEMSSYWIRQIKVGDVVEVSKSQPKKESLDKKIEKK
jgi:hypothetical protein